MVSACNLLAFAYRVIIIWESLKQYLGWSAATATSHSDPEVKVKEVKGEDAPGAPPTVNHDLDASQTVATDACGTNVSLGDSEVMSGGTLCAIYTVYIFFTFFTVKMYLTGYISDLILPAGNIYM